MGKGAVFIVCCSFVIIGVFIVMCYLMSKVNPPPLVRDPLPPPPKNVGRSYLYDSLFDNPTKEYGKYRLWKSEEGSLADIATFSTAQILFDQEYNTLWTFPTVRIINPAPPGTVINRTTPLPILKVLNKTEEVDRETTTAGVNGTLILIPVKRSVKEFKKIKGEINSVILRIIDDSGQFNIEIKIGSNGSYWKGDEKNRVKKKPTLSMYLKTKNDDIYEEADLAKGDGNELNSDSVDLSMHDKYDKTFGNKTKYLKDLNQMDKNGTATDISINGTFNYNDTSKYNSTYIDDGSNVTAYTLDYNSTVEDVPHDENSIDMNATETLQRHTTNTIKDYYDIPIPENYTTLAPHVTNDNVDLKDVIDVDDSLSSNDTYNATINRTMQLEDNATSNIVQYTNNTLKKPALYANNNPYTFFFENATKFPSPAYSKTFEFIDNALSKVIKKGNATKKYKGDIYGFTITEATKHNMDIDNLIPMENVNPNVDNTVTITEIPVTKKSLITPFELSTHAKTTILFKVNIKNNNSLQIKRTIQKDNDTMLKINKSGKYKNLPIVLLKSKEFALDSGSDQGSAVKDTR
ncbi:uncharacterized protein LOC126912769 [Spodoptera frugiperda]|uniref:Uncharacterized protein LOC126912769 n=1 Tax=Spodoptera frugiperda TaxID=7108 RepID=A0A9R0ECG6_SPOFR|nr:uncharacterized protein LOC126912769 [Spodoptera frugiperda]